MYNMSTKKLQQTGHISEATLHIVLVAYAKNDYLRYFTGITGIT